MPKPNWTIEPAHIRADESMADMVRKLRATLAAPGHLEQPARVVVIPLWQYEDLLERYSLTWPDDVLRAAEREANIYDACADVAERYGDRTIGEAIRAAKPKPLVIG